MGKPAARLGDTTAHGGTIALGLPTILIGKMPTSALGDLHVCPMCTGPVPHVGGPISLGSMGVLVGKKPAARLSDMTVCVGPPSMPVMGSMTVLIGEVGSGSQAGSAASALSTAAAKKKGPKSLEPFPLAEPPSPRTEIHNVECELVDSAGRSLAGVAYTLTDPQNQVMNGVTTVDGKVYHGGYSKAGSFKLEVKEIKNAKWEKDEAKASEEIKLEADADGFPDGTKAFVGVFAEIQDNGYLLSKTIETHVSGKKIKSSFKLGSEFEGAPADPEKSLPSAYFFVVMAEGLVGVSKSVRISDFAEFKFTDGDGKAMADMPYEITFGDGTRKKGKLGGDGKARLEDVPPGPFKVRFFKGSRKK
jgi:uncharacterized Zn-binding protein involved in type VI secretion